jgi:hypothetical protein
MELTAQTLAVPGEVYADLELREGDVILATASFTIQVEPNPLGDVSIESTSEFQALTALIEQTDELIAQVSAEADRAEAAAETFTTDPTLSIAGKAADAAATGGAIDAEESRAKAAEEANASAIDALNSDCMQDRGNIATFPSSVDALMDYEPGFYRFAGTNAIFPVNHGILEVFRGSIYGLCRITSVDDYTTTYTRQFNASSKTWYQTAWIKQPTRAEMEPIINTYTLNGITITARKVGRLVDLQFRGKNTEEIPTSGYMTGSVTLASIYKPIVTYSSYQTLVGTGTSALININTAGAVAIGYASSVMAANTLSIYTEITYVSAT